MCADKERNLILPFKFSRCILFVSFLSVGTSFYAFQVNAHDLMLMPLFVFITSVNYWRFPIYGWRRNIDITAVCSSILYKVYLIQTSPNGFYTSLSLMTGILFYIVGWLFHYYNYYHISTLFHCGVHLLANLSMFFLIIGTID